MAANMTDGGMAGVAVAALGQLKAEAEEINFQAMAIGADLVKLQARLLLVRISNPAAEPKPALALPIMQERRRLEGEIQHLAERANELISRFDSNAEQECAPTENTDELDFPPHWGAPGEVLAQLAANAVHQKRIDSLRAIGKLRGNSLSHRQALWLSTSGIRIAQGILDDVFQTAEQRSITALQLLKIESSPKLRRRGRPGPSLCQQAERSLAKSQKLVAPWGHNMFRENPAFWVAFVKGLQFKLYCIRTGFAVNLPGASIFHQGKVSPCDYEHHLAALIRTLQVQARLEGCTPDSYLALKVKFDAKFAEHYAKATGERLASITLKRRFQRLSKVNPFDLTLMMSYRGPGGPP